MTVNRGPFTTKDYDTGTGVDTVPIVGIALPASGGSVAGGTSTNPVRTDPVGTTTQPVSLAAAAASSSTDVSLASSASSAQLLAANASRKGLILTNTDANGVYIYFGTTATASKFTVFLPGTNATAPGTFASYEMVGVIYTGRIDAIWAADGSGSLIGSEF